MPIKTPILIDKMANRGFVTYSVYVIVVTYHSPILYIRCLKVAKIRDVE